MDEDIHNRVRKQVGKKKYSGYVFITCTQPTDNGNMDVELSYEGDPVLASYLLEGAQNILDEPCEDGRIEMLCRSHNPS